MSSGVASPRVLTIDDLRELARRRLPRMVFDYIDGGAEDEITLADNCQAFDTITFRPRGAVELASVNLRTTVLGASLELPFLLAPLGSSRMFFPRGEAAAAHVAGRAGTAYILSTLSGSPLEEVKARPRVRSGIRYISSADATSRVPRLSAPPPPAMPRWSSPSTHRSAGCARGTCETASESC